jgi:twitching motility two-component system response regulator PilH
MDQPKRILVVDDDALVRKLLEDLLGTHGYEVLSAGSGREGLALARAERPHAILMDIIMPDLDGAEVGLALEEDPRTCRIPVIFLTGLRSREEAARKERPGGHRILAKPVDGAEVLQSLAEVL